MLVWQIVNMIIGVGAGAIWVKRICDLERSRLAKRSIAYSARIKMLIIHL